MGQAGGNFGTGIISKTKNKLEVANGVFCTAALFNCERLWKWLAGWAFSPFRYDWYFFFLLFFLFNFSSSQGRNHLIRGGTPDIDKVFSISKMRNSVEYAAKDANVTLNLDYELILINVENLNTEIGELDDGPEVVSEHAYFEENPSVGQFFFLENDGRNFACCK